MRNKIQNTTKKISCNFSLEEIFLVENVVRNNFILYNHDIVRFSPLISFISNTASKIEKLPL
jgi:hypothetical protein